jgi:hypothetical protein
MVKMPRKMLTREVTHTTVKLGRIVKENDQPVLKPLEDQTMIGNVDVAKAQKELSKHYDFPVTVFEVHPQTEQREMPLEDFIKHSKVKEPVVDSAE